MQIRNLSPLFLLALTALSPALTFHVSQPVGAGSFYADFSLVDGQFGGLTNSTVTITNLSVTKGSIDASLSDLGDVVAVPNGFKLLDGPAFTSVRTTAFTGTAGSILSFDLSFESTADYAIEPDYFAYRLLDASLDAAGTTGFASEFVAVELGKNGSPAPLVFDKFDRRTQFAGVGTPSVQAVPEPASCATLGLAALALLRRRRARS